MKRLSTCLFFMALIFTQGYSQINWTKDPTNPVLERGNNGTWDDALVAGLYTIFDGLIYHGWYAGYDGNGTNIGYASSMDGINWTKHSTPILLNGPGSSWDDFVVYQPSVYFDGEIYHMWFSGHNGPSNRQIGYATSEDSINWTKHEENPVLIPGSAGSWDDQFVDSPFVLKIDSVYHMWYSGNNGSVSQSGHATSLDGITWEKDMLNPVLKVGEEGNWDTGEVIQPSILIDKNSKYHMFYSGGRSFEWSVGYASSMDGRIWTKYYKPVMKPGSAGSWDDTYTGLFTVSFNEDSSGFNMWYTGDNTNTFIGGEIGFATSPLEPTPFKNTWYKHPQNPVFATGIQNSWDDQFVSGPTIIVDQNNRYHMWYSGFDGGLEGSRTGYAFSDDGIDWERHPDPVLPVGNLDSWDALTVFQPSVLYDEVVYHMWFTGHNGITTRQIGHATSIDKINWVKDESNPVLEPGPNGSWDDQWLDSPDVIFIEGVYHMWYSGNDGAITEIGHAISLDGVTWEKDPANPVLTTGISGSWDDFTVGGPTVLYDGHIFHMWYGGGKNFAWDWRTGYAYSSDGSTWFKSSVDNPVMDLGDGAEWDNAFVFAGGSEIMIEDTTLKMWYGGGSAPNIGHIGYAQSDTLIITDIGDYLQQPIPLKFSLLQNFPNPFNPSTTITYQLAKRSNVNLSIYNMLGQNLITLVNKKQRSGNYSVQWDATGFASGIYFYTLQTNTGFSQTKKLILVK